MITDNAFLTQSRFILMEPMLLLLSLLGLLCVLKFRKLRERPYCVQWWLWLSLAATFLTLGVWLVAFKLMFQTEDALFPVLTCLL